MSFEAGDVVRVIYSFHYQGFTTLLGPNRLPTGLHTVEVSLKAYTLPECG